MLALGAPMYICATSSTPLAAAMILKGLSPGAALVFLLAGPATNVGSLMVIRKFMGTRSTIIYMASIAISAIALGLCLDWMYMLWEIKPTAVMGAAAQILPHEVELVSSILFLALCAKSLQRKYGLTPAVATG
jgi:hypothetical protein